MEPIHRLLAYGAVAIVAIGLGWTALALVRPATAGPGERFQAAVVALFIVGAASGLVVFAEGSRPADALHLLYGALAVGAIPLARSFVGRSSGRRAAILLLAAFIVLAGLVYRLFATG